MLKPIIFICVAWIGVIGFALYDLGRGSNFTPYTVDLNEMSFAGATALTQQIDDRFKGNDPDLGNFCALPERLDSTAIDAADARMAIGVLQQYGLIAFDQPSEAVFAIVPGRWTNGPVSSLLKAFTFREEFSCFTPIFSPYLLLFFLLVVSAMVIELIHRKRVKE